VIDESEAGVSAICQTAFNNTQQRDDLLEKDSFAPLFHRILGLVISKLV